MRIGIATDHGGFELKQKLIERLRAASHQITDFGAHQLTPDDDYPDFVIPLGQAVAVGKVDRGVAVCGSGVGACVCQQNQWSPRLSGRRPLFRKAGC
jgi:ribose 5-phosphate isomerase B